VPHRFAYNVVFITGASSGIGAALGREFAREGAKVALTARRLERVEALQAEIEAVGGHAIALTCDVRDRQSIEQAAARTADVFGGVDVVVANAGFSISGVMTRFDTPDYRRQFETNFFGVIDTIYALLPYLIRTRGRLGIVSSVAGRVGLPASAVYAASKFALVGLAESIYYDLADQGISVTCLNPGTVATESRSIDHLGQYTDNPDPVPGWLAASAQGVARKMVRALYRRQPEVIFTAHGIVLVLLSRHAPRLLRLAIRLLTRGRLDRVERLKRGNWPAASTGRGRKPNTS